MGFRAFIIVAGLGLAACSPSDRGSDATMIDNRIMLRNLTDSEVARTDADRDLMRLKGTQIPTPSDTRSDYFLLRQRTGATGTIVAILREERGNRVAYARTELDCRQRLFHIVGVAPSRRTVEVATAHDGPLRSIEGLPLRADLAQFICAQAGTPLAPA